MKMAFLITSVINPTTKPLSYSATRSLFNPSQREKQTVATVKSIKKYFPQSKITIVELGIAPSQKLCTLADQYIFLGESKFVRIFADSSFKALGETIGILFSTNKAMRDDDEILIKISGRYQLNSKNTIRDWNPNKFNFKLYDNSVSTRLYGIGRTLIKKYKFYLLASFLWTTRGASVETVLYKLIPSKLMKTHNCLGISGEIGTDGSSIRE